MELFHVLNRGVDGRRLFVDDADRIRFTHDLYEFNDSTPAPQFSRRTNDVGLTMSNIRERLVDLHGWCVMKNHYHLLLSERVEGGLSLFVRKLNVGYARAFNEKHKRLGTLFAGRTKRILVEQQAHFLYILHYVHLNPLDYLPGFENWRERHKGSISNVQKAVRYLDTYRWSSYLDYAGKKNFPSLITKNVFEDRPGEYAEELRSYLYTSAAGEDNSLWLE